MIFYFLVLIGILACSLSQILLKKSASIKHQSPMYEIINPKVILGYSIFFVSFLINIWAMRNGVQLKEMAILESFGYIFVPLLSWYILKEQISIRNITSIGIILLGIIVFYL